MVSTTAAAVCVRGRRCGGRLWTLCSIVPYKNKKWTNAQIICRQIKNVTKITVLRMQRVVSILWKVRSGKSCGPCLFALQKRANQVLGCSQRTRENTTGYRVSICNSRSQVAEAGSLELHKVRRRKPVLEDLPRNLQDWASGNQQRVFKQIARSEYQVNLI